jgi:signal transduction histidine kinase
VIARKSKLSLAAIGILILGNQVLVQPSLMRLTTDAPLINLAGRQRMLSQRLAKAALAFERGGVNPSSPFLGEIREALDLWTSSHTKLWNDARENGSRGPAIRASLEGLETPFVAMRTAAAQLTAGTRDGPSIRDSIAEILLHEPEYLTQMDQLVGLYEAEARGRLETFRRLGWLFVVLTLAGLLAIWRLILRPVLELISRQVTELADSRDSLEERVRERTLELEIANERHRKLVEQFGHVGRISAVGEMASSLAHELNQPLGAIANYAEGCQRALDAPEPPLSEIRDVLQRLQATSLRAGRILERVRRFATRQGPIHNAFDVNAAVGDVSELLGLQPRRGAIVVKFELAPGLLWGWGDPIQIQQVLVNLIGNALDSVEHAQPEEPTVVVWTKPSDDGGVELGVRDNGEGISADRIAQVFDAYFSTRAGGMGMGLAICRTIVEAHHGRILVESEPGVGTTFRVLLPAAEPNHESADRSYRG